MNDSRQLIDDCQTVMCLLTIKCLFRTEALALDLTSGRVSGVGVWLMCVICNFFFYFREKTASSLCTALWPTFFFDRITNQTGLFANIGVYTPVYTSEPIAFYFLSNFFNWDLARRRRRIECSAASTGCFRKKLCFFSKIFCMPSLNFVIDW